MGSVTKNCECCGKPMQVRSADLKRGWGRFCSKSCKASAQERRTGQNRDYLASQSEPDQPRAMSMNELAGGGYGDSEPDSGKVGDDKWVF